MRILTKALGFLGMCGLLALFVPGCSDKQETREIEFSLSRYSVAFAVEGGTITVEVGTSDSWTASTAADWLTLSQSGSALLITAEANTLSGSIREAEVIVATNSYGTETVQVRQEPGEQPALSVECGTTDRLIDSEGGEFTMSVSCNCEWSAVLASAVSGWDLTYDVSAGTARIIASANSGAAVTGTVVFSAGKGDSAVSESIEVTQISRDDNPYFKYTGSWTVNGGDCYDGYDWAGTSGAYASCSIAENDYSHFLLSIFDWGYPGSEYDGLEYSADSRTVTLPLGGYWGYVSSLGLSLYMAVLDEDLTSYWAAGSTVRLTLSEDGSEITVSDFPTGASVLGLLGRSGSYLYFIGGLPYIKTPVTMTRSEGGTSSLSLPALGTAISHELPEGVPDRLESGSQAPILSSEVLNL